MRHIRVPLWSDEKKNGLTFFKKNSSNQYVYISTNLLVNFFEFLETSDWLTPLEEPIRSLG